MLNDGLPYRDRSFDAIFCGEVIDHIRDVHWVLSEFDRVLRDGGLLIITPPYHGWIKYVIRRVVLVRAPFLPTHLPLAIFYALQSRGISARAGSRPKNAVAESGGGRAKKFTAPHLKAIQWLIISTGPTDHREREVPGVSDVCDRQQQKSPC